MGATWVKKKMPSTPAENLEVLEKLAAEGECHRRKLPVSSFYVHEGESISQAARQACRECGVQPECLAYALASELHGFWGGKSSKERRLMRNRMRKGLL